MFQYLDEILQSLPGTHENSHVVFHHANSSSSWGSDAALNANVF